MKARIIFSGLLFAFLPACAPKDSAPTYGYGKLTIKKAVDSTICPGADVHAYADSAGSPVYSVSGLADTSGIFIFQIETDRDTTVNVEVYYGTHMGVDQVLIHPNETTQTTIWCY